MKKLLLATTALFMLGACSVVKDTPLAVSEDVKTHEDSKPIVPVNHVRVCDQNLDWSNKTVASDVPDRYKHLLGLWTGQVNFTGDGNAYMCIAVAVQDVDVNGKTDSVFVWNLGDGPTSTNIVSFGKANWPAETHVLFADKGEQIVFAGDAPYHGKWWRYVLNPPVAPDYDTITGNLEATATGDATSSDVAKWNGSMETHPVTLKLTRKP
jgi:hypothetical protein